MPKVTQLELECTDDLAPGHFSCCFRYPQGDQSARSDHSDWLDFQQPGHFSNLFFFCLHLQNKEIEELTKICDELIAKMGKS